MSTTGTGIAPDQRTVATGGIFRSGDAGAHLLGDMSTTPHVEQLRASARHLRSLASAIGASRALAVYSFAGADTWVGPTQLACYAELVSLRRQLQTSQQALTDTAHRIDRQADAIALQPPGLGLAS